MNYHLMKSTLSTSFILRFVLRFHVWSTVKMINKNEFFEISLMEKKEKKKNCANLIFHSQNVSMTIFCERKAKCVYCYFSGAFLPWVTLRFLPFFPNYFFLNIYWHL